ncbi:MULTISPECIES: hypothetical protein [Flammeovirga]|uniref:Uncharacterized protein n=1 Tax=Flammeovirga agarivorans TaxID=2726742 RepID=A0A7X8SNZ5_9BACT|nr:MULTISPECIES: hypothetical protein [Flammeovirga]NLR93640.1 hypothetical protein [Flammeovirga agarivorans]
MTYPLNNLQEEQQIINAILRNDQKRKKWLKASNWLKTQMIKWEIQNIAPDQRSVIIKNK